MRDNVPVRVGNAPVDLEKWLRVVQENPERGNFLPTQIASTAELKERTMKVLTGVKAAKTRV